MGSKIINLARVQEANRKLEERFSSIAKDYLTAMKEYSDVVYGDDLDDWELADLQEKMTEVFSMELIKLVDIM